MDGLIGHIAAIEKSSAHSLACARKENGRKISVIKPILIRFHFPFAHIWGTSYNDPLNPLLMFAIEYSNKMKSQ